jgi:hypothetical protein
MMTKKNKKAAFPAAFLFFIPSSSLDPYNARRQKRKNGGAHRRKFFAINKSKRKSH